MTDTSNIRPYLKPREVAELLGVDEVTLWRWRRDGSGPRYHRVGPRALRYAAADVSAYLESRAALEPAA